jgi:hypothetical protein
MLRLAVCAFLEPQPDGAVFGADEIPLHVTVVGNFGFDGDEAPIIGAMTAVRGLLPVAAPQGEDALFGPRSDVPVILMIDAGGIRRLHDVLLADLVELGVEVEDPHYTGDGFRPHLTRVGGTAPDANRPILLVSLSLLDLHPDGNAALRRVVSTVGTGSPAR